MTLKGKCAIITGASAGFGAALARRLAREEMHLVLAARRIERLEQLARELESGSACRILPVRCDVSRSDEGEALIRRAVEWSGQIDVLVNNAGRGHFAPLEETTDETIQSMFAVNVFSLWHTTRPVLRHMKVRGSGHIINIASIAGKIGLPYNSAYVAAKHAVVGFTHALRTELMETGIHATVVCPGGVLTDWAETTEGGPILELFSRSGPAIKAIARERNLPLPPMQGVMSADAVAEKIVDCLHHPSAEIFTHDGSREFAALAAQNREEAERYQLAVALGERKAFEQLRRD